MSETKQHDKHKKTSMGLVPKLRFPAFRQCVGWQTKTLGSQGKLLASLSGKSAKDFNQGSATFVTYMNVFSNTFTNVLDRRAVDVAEDESQNAIVKGDVFFTVSSETPEDAGMSSVLLEDIENCYLNSFCTLFRFDKGKAPNSVFLGYFLRSVTARRHLSRGAQGATRYNISKSTFRDLPILLPSPPEQQKIADCLGSLDELISAEVRKLAALRNLKRGFMQQLFPQPGATQPRLRFPEFQAEGEWVRCTIGDVANISKGKGIAKADIIEGGATPCIRYAELYTTYGEVINEVKSQTDVPIDNLVVSEAGDVIIPASGETKEDIATCACVINAGVALGSDLNVLRSEIDGRFFSYYLNGAQRSELAKVAQGYSVAHLYPLQISELKIAVPLDETEQQRIADCLAALDSNITLQAAKIDALRQHMRGLKQQLFPVPEEQ